MNETIYSSKIILQKQKLIDNEFVSGESLEFTNRITNVGLNSLDQTLYAPDFPQHYIHIGQEYNFNSNEARLSNFIQLKNADVNVLLTTPQDLNNSMLLRTYTCSTRFNPLGNVTIQEIGIGKSQDQDDCLFTRTYLKALNGEPLKLKLESDEYLLVTYIYQIRNYQYLPNNLDISGNGIPEGTKACLYRVQDSNTRGYYYYDSLVDFENSKFQDNFDNFYREDNKGLLFNQNFGTSPFSSNSIQGQSSGYQNMIQNSQKMPKQQELDMSTFIPPFSTQNENETRYICQIRMNSHFAYVLNEPIRLSYVDSLSLKNLISYTVTSVPYTDPREYK